MLHVFIGEILADMTQVSDVAPGPLVFLFVSHIICIILQTMQTCKHNYYLSDQKDWFVQSQNGLDTDKR
jgi:hypothetical protein